MVVRLGCAVLAALALAAPAWAGTSVFTSRIDDPQAVYVTPQAFGVHPDGSADDSAAIQAAIDKANTAQGQGLVFLPSGRYRLAHTVYVWSGVRVIGYGPTRPVFVLADNTPGFQSGVADMVMFAGVRPGAPWQDNARPAMPPPGGVPGDPKIPDANPDTFYSAVSNIDFEIGAGNPAAIAIRFHVAQHSYLSHIDMRIGSGLAGLTQVGNDAYDLRFFGGRYGILTEKTSPAWQFTLLDSVFKGQREAAIREHEAGLTLVRDRFEDAPVAVAIDQGYPDQLWIKDSRFSHITHAVVSIGDPDSRLTEVSAQGLVLQDAPVFAELAGKGGAVAGAGPIYQVDQFVYGLILPGEGEMGQMGQRYDAHPLTALPASLPPAIRALPPVSAWVDVRSLGVKGDGSSDDTAALQAAVDAGKPLYFPSGYYVLRDTIKLRPDSVLIGLHPNMTQLDLPDNTPGFQGVGPAKALVEAPAGGADIVTGLGFYTGGFNPRVVSLKWMSGEASLADDLQFQVAYGRVPATIAPLYQTALKGRAYSYGRWGAKYPSLWVTAGGGGAFNDIWTPDTTAQAGFFVSDTDTPGHVYELSNEHHLFNEIRFDHVAHWDINAPQTEEEAPTSAESVSLDIENSHDITIADWHAYRVVRTHAPFPAAARIYNSSDIHFRNAHVNNESGYAHCDDNGCGTFLRAGRFPYDNSIQDMTRRIDTREREFAALDIGADVPAPKAGDASAVLAPGAGLQTLETGFFSPGGAAVDAGGKLYFVDHHQQRIFAWSQAGGLQVVRDEALDAVSLAFDPAGDLIVLSSAGPQGTVYALRPGAPGDAVSVLAPQAAAPVAGALLAIPANYWVNGEFRDQLNPATMHFNTLAELFARDVATPAASQRVSPDGALVWPTRRVFDQGPDDSYPGHDDTGWRWSDDLNAIGFLTAKPGQRIYVANDSENRTYAATVRPDGTLGDLAVFAPRGGESVAVDGRGNVYVANGQVFVYDPAGHEIGRIDVPERPQDLVFGGADGRTLFILGRHSLYSVEVAAGR